MSALLHRRWAFQVRRDASETLSNGRVLYDALFGRWGIQPGKDGNEFRSFEEVEASLPTLSLLPGVLLHPETNFGTTFGEGSYPVRGATGDTAVMNEDGIHASGKIMVWDDEWNAAIASLEAADLSLGYSILADETPGTAPSDAPGVAEFGADYVLSQTQIIGDHCAGVPEGNAGTARVVADAAKYAQVTRKALADIASARMDARPLIFDLGSWPKRQPKQDSTTMDPKQYAKMLMRLDGKARKAAMDAWVDIYGESNDPDMMAAMSALGAEGASPAAPEAPAPAPAPVADAEEEEPEEKTPPPSEGEEEPEEEEPEEVESKMDARIRREDERSDVLEVARRVFAVKYQRSDAKGYKRLTVDQIRSAVVLKLDPTASARVDKLDAKQKPTGTALEFSRLRDQIDAAPDHGAVLLERINATREDSRETANAEFVALQDKIRKQREDAANNVVGST